MYLVTAYYYNYIHFTGFNNNYKIEHILQQPGFTLIAEQTNVMNNFGGVRGVSR